MAGKNKRNIGIFIDRDGTLIEDKAYLSNPEGVEFIENSLTALKLLAANGLRLFITTNQSGIARKLITVSQLQQIHDRINKILSLNNLKFDDVYFCRHHPDDKCSCRKPNIEMALTAKRKFGVDLSRSYSIGDKMSDVAFGKNFGGKGILVLTGIKDKGNAGQEPDYTAKDLKAAANWIIKDMEESQKQCSLKKNLCTALLLLFVSISSIFSQEVKNNISSGSFSTSISTLEWRCVENKAFSVDEKLTYSIHWGPISAGWAEMRIAGIDQVCGRKAYRLVTVSRSHPFFDSFYKVDNLDQSWIDVKSICSLKYEKRQREGSYRKEEYVLFDHENKTAKMKEKYMDQDYQIKENAITPFIEDILSGLYYIRTKNLKVGDEYFFDVQAGDKVYSMKVSVLRKDKVSVPVGKFNCFVVEPAIAGNAGVFVAKGQLWVWLTDDERKIPVYMKSKIFIGSISADLVSMKF